MKSNYDFCLKEVLKSEGGYTNDPSDSGGPTNFGITLADYRLHINRNGTAKDVRNMSLDEAKAIYKAKYWDALDCDSLPSGVDYTCFDYGVNSGLGRPKKALQRFKDKSGVDIINAINDERVTFLHAISSGKNAKFLKGWMARVNRVRSSSLQLAKKDNVSAPISTAGVSGLTLWAANFWHSHEYIIIGCGLALAITIGVAIHIYRNRGKYGYFSTTCSVLS